jgi:hypothetical protein
MFLLQVQTSTKMKQHIQFVLLFCLIGLVLSKSVSNAENNELLKNTENLAHDRIRRQGDSGPHGKRFKDFAEKYDALKQVNRQMKKLDNMV